MLIDCDTCAVRGPACGDCVMGVLLGTPPGVAEFDESEQCALHALADAGLVPRLRLVPTERLVSTERLVPTGRPMPMEVRSERAVAVPSRASTTRSRRVS
jgi:hypothetical protein